MEEQLELVMRARDQMSGAVRSATRNVQTGTRRASRAMAGLGRASRAASTVVVGSLGAIKAAFTALIGIVGKLMATLAPLLAIFAAGFTVVGAISSFRSLRDELDDLDKMAIRTHISVEELSKIDFMAGLAGTDLNRVLRSMERLNRQAVRGHRVFEQLNVSVRETNGQMKDAQTLFYEVGRAIADIEDPAERAGMAMEAFGSSGTQLLPLLLSDMEAAREEAEALGLVLTTQAATGAAELGDAYARFGGALRGIQLQIQTKLMPTLAALFNALAYQIAENRDLVISAIRAVSPSLEGVISTVAVLGRIVIVLRSAMVDLWHGMRVMGALALETATHVETFRLRLRQLWLQGREMLGGQEAGAELRAIEWQIKTLDRIAGGLEGRFKRIKDEARDAPGLFTGDYYEAIENLREFERDVLEAIQKISVGQELAAVPDKKVAEELSRIRSILEGIGETFDGVKQGFIEGLELMAITAMDIAPKIQNALVGAFNRIEGAAVDSMEAFISGSKSAGEALREFGRAFVQTLIRMIAQMLVAIPIAILFNVLTGGSLAAMGATTTAAQIAQASALGRGATSGMEEEFADGGVVRRPTRALIGEAGPEAVVPLPNGRSIPVEDRRKGGGSPEEVNITFQVQALDAQGVDSLLLQRRELFKDIIAEAMSRDLGFRQTVRSV